MTSTEQRLVQAEETIAHQAKTIDELSAMVARQWDVIDALQRRVDHMIGRMSALEENLPAPAASEKPPHW
jgi:SlyX protein